MLNKMKKENKGTMLMEKYEIGRLLGKGTFAKVYYAKNVKTTHSVAIKVIDKEKVLKVGLMDQIKREISVMRLVEHPNVVQLYEVLATKTKIYFVLEYVRGGELFSKVSKGRFREDTARKYFQQLIRAMDYCHSRGVFHRDLKPENILLDENGALKVSDFGLSALSESKRQDGLLHTTCGTPAYVAPEVINQKGYDGAKADIWSCGVILFVLMVGYLPFQDSNVVDLYRRIEKAEFKCPNWIPSEVKRLLLRILDPNPCTRISIEKIIENPWFKKGLNGKTTDIEKGTSDIIPVCRDELFSPVHKDANDEKLDMEKFTNMNAFDIISLSAGFDLSCIFEEAKNKREARFTSNKPASTIISKLVEVATRLKLKIRKKDNGVIKMEGNKAGRKGVSAISFEIFEFTPHFHLVEIKKTNGDTLEYHKTLKQDIRPALKDIVWAWQGVQQQQ